MPRTGNLFYLLWSLWLNWTLTYLCSLFSFWLFLWPSHTTRMLCRQPAHRDAECNSRCPAPRPPPVFSADGPPPTTCSWSSGEHFDVLPHAVDAWEQKLLEIYLGLQYTHLLQSFHLVQVQGPHFSCHCFRSTAPGLLLLNILCCSGSDPHSWSTVFPNYLLKISLYSSHSQLIWKELPRRQTVEPSTRWC